MSTADGQLLAIGKQCSHPSCLLIDFLPFKCQHCEQSFCQEHFKVAGHQCPKYDETKHNRVAPDCPFCNTPVAVRIGQDPNDRMEDHILKECSVTTGKSGKTRTMPVCAKTSCKKALFSPIRCDKCRNQFCPSHRFPSDHSCPAHTRSPDPKPSGTNRLGSVRPPELSNKASAALNAIKKATSSASTIRPAQKLATPLEALHSKSGTSSRASPFSKTERRARSERESKVKAMQARAKKGLLSEEEKAILAAEEKELADKKDCTVM